MAGKSVCQACEDLPNAQGSARPQSTGGTPQRWEISGEGGLGTVKNANTLSGLQIHVRKENQNSSGNFKIFQVTDINSKTLFQNHWGSSIRYPTNSEIH